MLKTLAILPFSFWVATLLLLAGIVWATTRIRQGIGLPVMAVLGTVAAWYMGDAFYNDYANNHAQEFTSDVLNSAWWQVTLFVAAFLAMTPFIHRLLNAREHGRRSRVYRLLRTGVGDPQFQAQLNRLFWGTLFVWGVLVAIAFVRLGTQMPYYFFPFLGYKADPWGRGRLGGGIDALLILAYYFQMFVASVFGLVAATAKDRRVRTSAIILCFFAWPYYIFDRTRNVLLAVVLPGILAWVFLRLRGGVFRKFAVLAIFFVVVNAWLGFVIANRSSMSITEAVKEKKLDLKSDEETHHLGLNMYEELCWINMFIKQGTYEPNWGQRYFAELVNPVPRSLWHNKPMIGIDYAIARGQSGQNGAETDESGVFATISTGMIGQGVVNFGGVLGPMAAALLMALWAAILARQDLRGEELGRLPLFVLGLVLTFNLGRDITLITLYTFFFGMAVVWWIKRRGVGTARSARQRRPRRSSNQPRLGDAAGGVRR